MNSPSKIIWALLALNIGLAANSAPAVAELIPKDVSYVCQDPKICPADQGVLLFYAATGTPGRCTGSLYEASKVVTDGHCTVYFDQAVESYFVTVAQDGRPSQAYRIQKVLAKSFVKDQLTTTPDYASFLLEKEVSGVSQFVAPAATAPANLDKVIALVSEPAEPFATTKFILRPTQCRLPVNADSPFAYADNPTVKSLTDCWILPGNSGGAVVQAENLNAVLGLVKWSNGGARDDDEELEYLWSFLRPNGEKSLAGMTNARCFSLPGSWVAPEPHCQVISEAMLEYASKKTGKDDLEKLKADQFAQWTQSPLSHSRNADGPQMEFSPEAVPMTYRPDPYQPVPWVSGVAFLPYPKCFKEAPTQKEFSIVSKGAAFDEPNYAASKLKLRIAMDFSQSGPGRYFVKYRVNYIPSMGQLEYQFNYDRDSRVGHLLEDGTTISVGVCP